MARANTYTWLPLDEWARLMGYNLWHFNNINVGYDATGTDGYACSGFWVQYPYQDEKTTRDELAEAIRQAEEVLANHVSYNLVPDWEEREILNPPRYYNPSYQSNVTIRGAPKSVQLSRRHVLAGGVRAKSAIQTNALISRVDLDGDQFDETATLTVTTDVNVNEIRLYYPNEDASDSWEIRPIQVTAQGDGTVVISFPIWLIVKRQHIEGIESPALDGLNDDSIFLTSVDVYRVYNDTSQQVKVIYAPDWEDCIDPATACDEIYYGDCLYVRDEELGYVVYNPQLREEPDKLEIAYYSGWRNHRESRPYTDMDPYWKMTVAVLAASLLDKEVRNCCGANNNQLVSRWRVELDKNTVGGEYYQITKELINNGFGLATRGAWYAYRRAEARRVT